jgi:pantoate kinase
MTDVAQAFVPGHVTGFFTVDRADDPTVAGSRGAGVALADGVTVSARQATDPTVWLNDEPVEVEAVSRVRAALEADVSVAAETDLPVGAGFGVSGAMALGTAIATNDLLDRALSERELVTIAHGAEVQAGTGLGDVVAQARGGMPIRLEPGGPLENEMDGIPARPRIECYSMGELPTDAVLADADERLSDAGEAALSRVVGQPTPAEFMRASRQFSRESGLLTDGVQDVVEAVAATGGDAAMAMLGETVFALGTGLSDAGYEPTVTRAHPAGATLQEPGQ